MTRAYYGTKRIDAWPQEKDGKPGYAVRYSDDYTSWSPKDVFEAAYQPTDAMNFGHALQAARDGHKVARAGWNGKGMFVFLVAGSEFAVSRAPLNQFYPEGTKVTYRPHLDMRSVDGQIGVWVASHSDMLANDWAIVA